MKENTICILVITPHIIFAAMGIFGYYLRAYVVLCSLVNGLRLTHGINTEAGLKLAVEPL